MDEVVVTYSLHAAVIRFYASASDQEALARSIAALTEPTYGYRVGQTYEIKVLTTSHQRFILLDRVTAEEVFIPPAPAIENVTWVDADA